MSDDIALDHDAPGSVTLGSRWRVSVVQILLDALLLGLVFALLPGIGTRFDVPWLGFVLLGFGYGVLMQFVRPVLDLLLLPFLVQTYGLVLAVVDVIVFSILVLIFGDSIEVVDISSIAIGGIILGIARVLAGGALGLSPPIVAGLDPTTAGTETSDWARRLPLGGDRVRLLRIRRALYRHGLDALFSRGETGRLRRRFQQFLWQPSVPISEIGPARRFRLLLQDLGPTYVKIGQIISSRARALPPEWHEELEKLQSDAPPYPYADVRDRIERELGAPPEVLYAWFDPEPLAAASLAQVHRAELHDGQRVAVKVQRPNIQAKLESDVALLTGISDVLASRSAWANEMDLGGIVAEFGSTLLRELDYKIEAYNARRLNKVLEPVENVRVPLVHHELSSSGVLTLEFIDGVKSTKHDEIVAAGLDTEHLATQIIHASVEMLVFEGFFHADPHPGNVFVDLETGDVTLLDTGMVGELTFAQRLKLAGLAVAVNHGDLLGLAQALKSLSTPFREADDALYYREFVRRLTPFFDPPPGERMDVTGKVIPNGMAVLRESGYRIDPEFTLALKSMTQAEAITSSLVPDWTGTEFMQRALVAGEQIIQDDSTTDKLSEAAVRQASFLGRELLQELPSLQGGARQWIDALKDGGVTVRIDSSGFDEQVRSLRGISQTVTLGIVVAGLVVGSAIAAGIGGADGSVLQPVTGLAAVVYTVSSVAGVGALLIGGWRLARQGRKRR